MSGLMDRDGKSLSLASRFEKNEELFAFFLVLPALLIVGFKRPELLISFWRTVRFTISSVAIVMVADIAFAVAYNERFKGRAVSRSIIIIPWAIPPVVNGIIWNWLVHPKIGVLNIFLTRLH
jgi:ABC-type sugar transport system permease subunit